MIEQIEKAIAEKFAPAIDCKAPYAKIMINMAAKEIIKILRQFNYDNGDNLTIKAINEE